MKKSARGAANPNPKENTADDPHARGKPAHIPTKKSRARVHLLAGLGFTQDEMSLLLDLGKTALIHHYGYELRVGGLEADEKVMTNLFRLATGKGPEAGRMAIFWAKVNRRWHEVHRVIHGFDPEMIKVFVKSTIMMFRREIPDACPSCKAPLNITAVVAQKMIALSAEMAAKLPPSEIVNRAAQAMEGQLVAIEAE